MKDTLFAIGEALIDFIPSDKGCDFSEVRSFSPKTGGAPANVLGAFAKLGGKTQLLTQLGDDPFGHKIAAELGAFNIGLDHLKFTKAANTALAFVSLGSDGDRTFSFYRNPSADMLYTAENIGEGAFESCYALHFCSVSLGDFPMKAAHKRAIEYARGKGAIICFDPNVRLPLWRSKDDLKAAIDEFLPMADIIKLSDEETELVTGCTDIAEGCRSLLKSASVVLCTCGAGGAYAYTRGAEAFAPQRKVDAKDTTGAGDAFIGSFLYNLYRNGVEKAALGDISKEKLTEFLSASNNYCAASVQKYGAIESYPEII